MKVKWLSAALVFLALSIPRVAAGAEKDDVIDSQSVTEELKKSGEHLWRATRIAAEKTRNGIKKAAQNIRQSSESLHKQNEEKQRSKDEPDSRRTSARRTPATDRKR